MQTEIFDGRCSRAEHDTVSGMESVLDTGIQQQPKELSEFMGMKRLNLHKSGIIFCSKIVFSMFFIRFSFVSLHTHNAVRMK